MSAAHSNHQLEFLCYVCESCCPSSATISGWGVGGVCSIDCTHVCSEGIELPLVVLSSVTWIWLKFTLFSSET